MAKQTNAIPRCCWSIPGMKRVREGRERGDRRERIREESEGMEVWEGGDRREMVRDGRVGGEGKGQL